MDFKNIKKQILERVDASKKGSVDDLIVDLVNYINSRDEYVTTSSCAGRALLFTTGFEATSEAKKPKRECKWLYTCHDLIDVDEFLTKVDPSEGDLVFKYEPFILHVLCSSLDKARILHVIASAAGYKDSGITINRHGKVMLAVRGNLRLEVPISQSSVMLVSEIYLKYLMEIANEKMMANQRAVEHFYAILRDTFQNPQGPLAVVSRKPSQQQK